MFLGACTVQEPLIIISEYLSGGNLEDYLISKRKGGRSSKPWQPPPKLVLQWCIELARAVVAEKASATMLRPDVHMIAQVGGPRYAALMERCWDNEPHVRPSAAQLVDELESLTAEFKGKKGSKCTVSARASSMHHCRTSLGGGCQGLEERPPLRLEMR